MFSLQRGKLLTSAQGSESFNGRQEITAKKVRSQDEGGLWRTITFSWCRGGPTLQNYLVGSSKCRASISILPGDICKYFIVDNSLNEFFICKFADRCFNPCIHKSISIDQKNPRLYFLLIQGFSCGTVLTSLQMSHHLFPILLCFMILLEMSSLHFSTSLSSTLMLMLFTNFVQASLPFPAPKHFLY